MRHMAAWFFALLALLGAACSASDAASPFAPSFFVYLDPDIGEAFEKEWETRPWPIFRRAEALDALTAHLQRRGVRAPAELWRRVLAEKPSQEASKLAMAALENYPGWPPAPLAEDPGAAQLAQFVASAAQTPVDAGQVVRLYARMLSRMRNAGEIVDFRFAVRRAIIDALPDLCRFSPPADELFERLLPMPLPAHLRARALIALGICRFDSPALLPHLVEDLFRVRDNELFTPFARTALTGAQGQARQILLDAVMRAFSQQPSSWARLAPFTALADLQHPVRQKNFVVNVRKNPFSVLRVFAALLSDMGEHARAAQLLLGPFQPAQRQDAGIPEEDFDAVWETLLDDAGGIEDMKSGLEAGRVQNAAVVLERLMRTCPPEILQRLREGTIRASVAQSQDEWAQQIRDAALRAALADPAAAGELTALWNRETTEEAQWQATRRFWEPRIRLPGEERPLTCTAADAFDGANPREWLLARLTLLFWACGAPEAEKAVQNADAGQDAVFWNADRERQLRRRAAECRQKRIDSLQAWEKRVSTPCKENFDCLWDALVRQGPNWEREAFLRALGHLEKWATPDAWRRFDDYFARVPCTIAHDVLAWATPHLDAAVRRRIRDRFVSQDPACLTVWMQAVRLANEPLCHNEEKSP